MIDLLVTTIIMFAIFMGLFILIKDMKVFNILLLSLFLVLMYVLLLDVYYRRLDSWKYPEEYHPIQKTVFLPIKSIKGIYDSNNNLINLDFRRTDGIFSIVKNEEYSKECLHNYYIKETDECPMTDIILETTQVNTYNTYVEQKITDNMYLYYTKESKLDGKLYEDISIHSTSSTICDENNKFIINHTCSNILFKSNFNYKNISAIIDLEEEKKTNPFKIFKNYSKYYDKILFLLVILIFVYTLCEPYGNKVFNYFKIINLPFHAFFLILLSIRYDKYRKLKQYLNKYPDIYEDYLPNKVMNYDTVLLSISISIFVYYIIYLIVPDDCHYCESYEKEENKKHIDFLIIVK